jgi:uncharacterized surface protein with fasciclin (FAS1) repeats
MTNSRIHPSHQDIEAALRDVARSLHKAAHDAEGLSKEASEALSKAAAEVAQAAEALRKHAAASAKNVVQKAVQEMQQHPLATLAAAITAAAAVVRIFAADHHGDA